MELQHFSHEHPLVLVNEVPDDKIVCYGCQKPILGSAYNCSDCNYFLHKKCGELPRGIKHPMHSEHPLTLLPYSPYEEWSWDCDVCGIKEWKWFSYHCYKCDFDAHIWCTQLPERTIESTNESKFHNHPLTFVQRAASFFCDACGTEGEDFSYRCTDSNCQFWIHDSCASSLSTIERGDHDHPLQLSYYFPYLHRNFTHSCYICKEIVHPTYWVYYCAACRYFAHLKCATSKNESLMLSDSKSEENLYPDVLHLPIHEESRDRISRLVGQNNAVHYKKINEFHNCDDYPLKISYEVESHKEMKNREVICDVCMQPISSSFYTCGQCSFIVHRSCSQLPPEIQHPYHSEHPLRLSRFGKTFNFFCCDRCRRYNIGSFYECETCPIQFDVCCATWRTIKHEAHKHLLIQSYDQQPRECTACGD